MKVGIIGATGMLGHHTALAAMARGHALVVIHRAGSDLSKLSDLKFESRQADLSDEVSLTQAMEQLDVVIHCAGYYPTLPRHWQDDVARALKQERTFYRACQHAKVKKIVYLGAAIALPKSKAAHLANESARYPAQPSDKNPYLQVKWAMDDLALTMAEDGLPVSIAIPSMTFGEFDYGPTTGRLLVEVANQTLPAYVEGKRNCIYAGDAGLGIVLVAEKGATGERYLLTGENTSMSQVVRKVAQVANVSLPKQAPLGIAKVLAKIQSWKYRYLNGPEPKISDTAIAVMSSGQHLSGEKAKRDLGFEASTTLDAAIEKSLKWFKDVGYIASDI